LLQGLHLQSLAKAGPAAQVVHSGAEAEVGVPARHRLVIEVGVAKAATAEAGVAASDEPRAVVGIASIGKTMSTGTIAEGGGSAGGKAAASAPRPAMVLNAPGPLAYLHELLQSRVRRLQFPRLRRRLRWLEKGLNLKLQNA